jgi:hypothetical protein
MPGQRARANVLLFCVLLVLLIVAVAAAASGVALVVSRQPSAAAGPRMSPLASLTASAINAPLALAELAGRPDEETLQQALSSGQLDTALAILLNSPFMSDDARSAGLTDLARRWEAAHKQAPALAAVRAAIDVALLSPSMPDHARAAALDQAGQVLASLGQRAEAGYAYDQATTIARDSGRIDPTLRQLLLEGLIQSNTRLGRTDAARQIRAALQSPAPAPDRTAAVLPDLLPASADGATAAWPELGAATEERMRLAADLANAIANRDAGIEAKRSALEAALLAEDRIWQRIDGEGAYRADNLLQSVAFARQRLEWQAIKWRVARRGFGLSLVPAWEQAALQIESDLAWAADDYYQSLRDAAVSLPDLGQANEAAVEIAQDQIKLGRLGIPQATSEAEVMGSLQRAIAARLAAGNTSLYLASASDDSGNERLTVQRPR